MGDPEKVQLTYSYTYLILKEAMRVASRQISRRGPSARRLGYILIASSAAIVVLFSVVIPKALDLGPEVAVFGFCTYLAATVLMWIYGTSLVGAIGRDMLRTSLYEGDIEMEMGGDGVSIRGKHTRCWLEWTAIEDIVEMKSGLGLFSGCCIYPIPDDALSSSMTRDTLRQRISAWRKAAR